MQAFALAHQQNPCARLIIAGFPTKFVDNNDLQRLAGDLGITQAVTFDARYIPIKEVASLMELASVVVYPYRNSTQSGALQVAYAFGRPVIATTVGGLPEAVENGRSGFLVPPETPEALASAILQIINNPQLAAEMGAYARHLSETRFSWTSIANQILAVYRDLLDSRGSFGLVMKNPQKLMEHLFLTSLFDRFHSLWPDRLTVLAYHRIGDPDAPGFDTFKPNMSATPAAFAAQMDFIRQRFSVISGSELVAWLQGQHKLPSHPALITFDDGYRDNFECALPILQQRNLPAIIFLATDYIGNTTPFYYDLAAYCFHHTHQNQVDLPRGRPAAMEG